MRYDQGSNEHNAYNLVLKTNKMRMRMSYTASSDKRIDEKIDRDLKIVIEEILKAVSPISIILFGGFGRGEGSAVVNNGQVVILKDYDILPVTKRKIPAFQIYQISVDINRRLGWANPLDSVSMRLGYGTDLLQFTLNDLIYLKDVRNYEIKVGSKLLWGKDIRRNIELTIDELSFWSGIRFLLRKVPGMCGTFSPDSLDRSPVGEEKETLIYECGKMYLDMATTLTLVSRTYKPSYCERMETIKNSFRSDFPELAAEMPHFEERIEQFTQLKLFPSKEAYDAFDPVRLWFETRQDLGSVIRYCVGSSGNDWAHIFSQCNRRMKGDFMDDMMSYYLAKRFKLSPRVVNWPLSKCANFAYQRMFCLRHMLKLCRKEGVLHLRALVNFPIFKVSTSGLMLLFSLNKDGTLNEPLFNSFVSSIRGIYPVQITGSTDAEKWEQAKEGLIKADRSFLDAFYETG